MELLFLALLGLGVAALSGLGGDDGDAQTDDPAEQTDDPPEQSEDPDDALELVRGTWQPDELSGHGDEGDAPIRIEGRGGNDTLHGYDGDELVGGSGSDIFTVVVDDPDAEPVFIQDLNFDGSSDETESDKVLFTLKDGTAVPLRGVLEAGLDAADAEDGTGALINYDGVTVAKVANATADQLNNQSIWIGNFSETTQSNDGDDYLVGDTFQNKDDHINGGLGNDTIIGGNGTDLLHGEKGNDFIDATDPIGASDNFDLVVGGEGDDTMRGDDGDYLYGTFDLEEGNVVVDIFGKDQFEVVMSDDPDADPVIIVGQAFGQGTNLGETLFLLHPDGTEVSQEELDENLTVETQVDVFAHSLIYDGTEVAVVFEATWLFDKYGVASAQNPAAAAELAERLGLSDALDVINVALTDAEGTGHIVPEALFGGNIVYTANTDQGDPVDNFRAAIDALDIDHVRYPGGQGDNLVSDGDGEKWLNVVAMEPNEFGEMDLRPELKVLLDWAQDPNGDGNQSDAKKVTLVLPTFSYTLSEYADFAPEIQQFTTTLMQDYGNVIEALEIGNEYWAMGETEYAAKANIAIDSVLKGFEAAGVEEEDQPDILVQMASPNTGSEFGSRVDDRDFLTRNRDANQQIIDGLSEQSKDALDGVVEHYYFNEKDAAFAGDSGDVNFINKDLEVWNEAFDKDLKLSITEWNIKNSNLDQNGLAYTGAFAEQVSRLVELDVNLGHIWAVQHNTATDLAGDRFHEPLINDVGHVVSTVRGAMFDVTTDALIGAELLELTIEGTDGQVEIQGYQKEDQMIFQISSRVAEEIHLHTDFSEIVPEFAAIQTVKISMDTSSNSSDGIHYKSGVGMIEAPYSIIDGQRFYYGEHDVRAVVTEGECTSNLFDRTLKPFETYQVIFYLDPDTAPPPIGNPLETVEYQGTEDNDFYEGGLGDDILVGLGGDDYLNGLGGNDVVRGGDGADTVIGCLGDDVVLGDEGDDNVVGLEGNDRLRGHEGNDTLNGGPGNDTMNGGQDNDIIRGGSGADIATGFTGTDTFQFFDDDLSAGDQITDFTPGTDVIHIEIPGISSMADLEFRLDTAAGGTFMQVGSEGTVFLKGILDLSLISAPSNFIFSAA